MSALAQIQEVIAPKLTSKADLMDIISKATDSDDLINQVLPKIKEGDFKFFELEQLLNALKKKTGVTLSALKADLTISSNQEQELNDLDIARLVLLDTDPANIMFSEGHFLLWRSKGVWESVANEVIKKMTHKILEDNACSINANKVNGITDLIRTESYKEQAFLAGRSDIINTLNSELHFKDGKWLPRPHDRNHYFTSQLNTAYDPEATAPRFEKFLEEVFKADSDSSDKKTVLLQMIGYSFLQNCEYESFVLLIGAGANGKSVVLEVLRALVGNKSASAVQPSQFDNKFQRGHLEGKLVNIVTEISEGHEIKDAELKAIVSGELTTAERKFQPPFEFQPYATCWFGTNHMPHTRDFSDALFRRAIILTFNNSFYGIDRDTKLKEKLVNELPGILNMALLALSTLFKDGGFVEPNSSQEAKRLWRLEADQVAQFTEECCETAPENETASQELYRAYEDWANDSGINRRLNRNNFTKRLQKLGLSTKRGTGGVRLIAGVKLNNITRFYSK